MQAVPDPERTALVYARVSTKEQAQGGGDGDGYSLPAQRDACGRKAQAMNAAVLDEFVDKGESTRTADRPELQRMLDYLAQERADYVIVHKIDRLARNRADDVAYATGDWSLNGLAMVLEDRGLALRSGPKAPARPVAANKLQAILRNRYYIGVVRWRGVEYDGKHEPLVTTDVFEMVQQVLTDHRTSGERSCRRDHYLAGSLRCGLCGNTMLYTVSRNHAGNEYGYFYCSSRTRKQPCGQRYLPEQLVEEAVERQWARESVSSDFLAELHRDLQQQVRAHEGAVGKEVVAVLETCAHAIRRERFRWLTKRWPEWSRMTLRLRSRGA